MNARALKEVSGEVVSVVSPSQQPVRREHQQQQQPSYCEVKKRQQMQMQPSF